MADRFKVAPLGAVAWVWTITYVGLFLFFAVWSLLDVSAGRLPDTFNIGFAVLLLVAVIWAWVRSVRGYSVEGENVVVERAGPGRLHIPLADIDRVTVRPDLGAFFNVSFISTGGVFGWAGRVRARKPSDVHSTDAILYGTNHNNVVMLDLRDGRKVLFTPDDPEAMGAALRAGGAGTGAGKDASNPQPRESAAATRPAKRVYMQPNREREQAKTPGDGTK